jgi:hypothetical protein
MFVSMDAFSATARLVPLDWYSLMHLDVPKFPSSIAVDSSLVFQRPSRLSDTRVRQKKEFLSFTLFEEFLYPGTHKPED